ncbi:MAG TPA: VWA domain-containing protein [Chthonomonadaceae bacterium]|nr:VWA domain-containing protein [Chthonomonadaceae bacterium]
MASLENSIEFAENPEPRCPCVLLLDTSRSMEGAPIEALNAGVRTFRDELIKDSVAARRVEIAVVSFDTFVYLVQPFVTVNQFQPPTLTVQGFTSMGTAIQKTLDLIQERKALYRANGMAYYRPWVLMITDGEPHGEADHVVQDAARRIREDEENKRLAFFAVGVQNASMQKLSQITVRPPVKLSGLNFQDMFVWLSTSMQLVSRSRVDEQIPLPPPGAVSAS